MDNNPEARVESLPRVSYGFIGLSQIGYPMAKNLRSRIPISSRLVVCEVVKPVRDQFVETTEGEISTAESPHEVATQADIIFTMLPKSPHVNSVFTDPKTGTIDVESSLEVGKAVADSGLGRFVDAPVSGGPNGARSASLTFMVGGPKEIFEEIMPLLSTMGSLQTIFHCGAAGAGLSTKQINNYLSGIAIIGVSEAMNMGVRYGLDPSVLAGVINVSSGKCYNSLDQNPVKGVTPSAAATKDFEGGFSMELCKGVLEMAVKLGKQTGAKSVLADIVLDTFEAASQDDRCKGKDCRSLYKWIAGIP